jgi:hypothetical protein
MNDLEETNSKLEMIISQLRMQLNDANSELEFNRGISSARGGIHGKAGEEDFNLERETLLTRIASIQN